MERDEETGLQCHGVRVYAPWLGRWTSVDPAGVRTGPNRYAYADNQPICKVDVNGREPAQPDTSTAPALALKSGPIGLPKPTEIVPPTIPLAEAQAREAKALQGANQAKDTPIAAMLMKHWLGGSGETLNLSRVLDIKDPKHGILKAVLADALPEIDAGIRKRFSADSPSSFANQPVQGIYYEGSAKIVPYELSLSGLSVAGKEQLDQTVALHGFTYRLEVDVRAITTDGAVTGAEITGGRLQIIDRYDWNVSKEDKEALASVPLPSDFDISLIPSEAIGDVKELLGLRFVQIKDAWFSEIESAGEARNFVVTSDVVDIGNEVRKTVAK